MSSSNAWLNLCFDGFGREARVEEDKSQWFTRPEDALKLLRWDGPSGKVRHILEPAAGSGNLIAAARKVHPDASVCAFEIDEFYVERIRDTFGSSVAVSHANYLERAAPMVPYDVCVMNPPYEDGADGAFLEKAMDESMFILAICRLAVLAGSNRGKTVWARCTKDGDWYMRKLAIFETRPSFIAGRAIGKRKESDGAKADFCAVSLARRSQRQRGVELNSKIEWWGPQ